MGVIRLPAQFFFVSKMQVDCKKNRDQSAAGEIFRKIFVIAPVINDWDNLTKTTAEYCETLWINLKQYKYSHQWPSHSTGKVNVSDQASIIGNSENLVWR